MLKYTRILRMRLPTTPRLLINYEIFYLTFTNLEWGNPILFIFEQLRYALQGCFIKHFFLEKLSTTKSQYPVHICEYQSELETKFENILKCLSWGQVGTVDREKDQR
jgi:hypothetical protein